MPHKDSEARRQYANAWRSRNLDSVRKSARRSVRRTRLRAIEVLGGRCVRCGAEDYRVLEFDHIHGGGGAERKTPKSHGNKLLLAIIRGERDDIQLLCANCHSIKTWHEENTDE